MLPPAMDRISETKYKNLKRKAKVFHRIIAGTLGGGRTLSVFYHDPFEQ
jgi:hypothetical protein